ncbi:nucleotidyltransferase domain-containing protein [Accumulibacter sp.]|uniref:nucleotidyltransferase domain-containing protein n=1 Tax=Accumulibacter sp. TaxID=2053492 RepID=UPI0025E10810|nr:nucleotidyltransferase domain-containing protein [Accumulibacter sp.]MCM8626650.1 nucleotidyltransferase domain-containing protein [Accumulibacter sp.]
MALTNHERVGKALERLNAPQCGRRSMMEWIDQARTCLAENLPNGSRMIVFGSQARGDARPDSDLDLLVIEPDVADRFAEIARLSTLLGQRLIPCDVVVMSAETFERQKRVVNTLAWRADLERQVHDFAT